MIKKDMIKSSSCTFSMQDQEIDDCLMIGSRVGGREGGRMVIILVKFRS